jgi:hypothetical protein
VQATITMYPSRMLARLRKIVSRVIRISASRKKVLRGNVRDPTSL